MRPISSILPHGLAGALCLIFAANTGIPRVSAQSAGASGLTPRPASAGATAPLAYADLADLATRAPLVAKGEISDVILLKPEQSIGVLPGHRRAYVALRTTGLIRGDGGVPPTLSYLYDIPLDERGKVPKLKKRPVLLFARAGARADQIQLVALDAQIDWTAARESTVRSIVSELLGKAPPPRITDIGDAFHVAGTVAGEGETQIFLRTDNGQPVSLSIVRRPGQAPRWAVALGEIVDEAAAPPAPGSLLWYRLACALPPALPAQAVRTLAVTDAEAARADYQLVLAGLGRCGRTRAIR